MSRRNRKKRAKVSIEKMAGAKKSVKFKEVPKGGLIVYGACEHLTEMLSKHKDLAERIVKVIDKDEKKIGQTVEGLFCVVESSELLKELPVGTQIIISNIEQYGDTIKELHELNSGLLCPDIDQAYYLLCEAEAKGMIVYGVGAHLADMLSWHPELKDRIGKVFDKDEKKQGQNAPGTECLVENLEELRRMPAGTRIAISAIRYLDEITEEIYKLNSGLICQNIDDAYRMLPPLPVKKEVVEKKDPQFVPEPVVTVRDELSNLQKQRLRGKEAAERWRRKFLMECANVRKVFWGTKGVRASYLRMEFQPLMGKGDIFIEEDLSMRGQAVSGLPICVPEVLKDMRGKFVIIVLSGNYPQVKERLRDYGYIENVDFVEGRYLLGEDENGYIDTPCIDKKEQGMIVYGQGAHLTDMLNWHPELRESISRIIDKDPEKIGQIVPGTCISIEPPAVLKDIPTGTEVVVSAIRYMADIEKDIHAYQPGILCRNIDEVWQEYV